MFKDTKNTRTLEQKEELFHYEVIPVGVRSRVTSLRLSRISWSYSSIVYSWVFSIEKRFMQIINKTEVYNI